MNMTLSDKIVVAGRFHTLHCLPVDQSTFEQLWCAQGGIYGRVDFTNRPSSLETFVMHEQLLQLVDYSQREMLKVNLRPFTSRGRFARGQSSHGRSNIKALLLSIDYVSYKEFFFCSP